MEVRSGRQGESEVPRQTYLCRGLEAAVAADFDRVAAALSKVPEQGLQDAGRKSIAIGMRKYRLAAGAMDPVNYQGQLRPGGWYVTGTTGTEVTTERVAGVAHVLLFHQEAGEMAATDRRTISGMAHGTRQAAGYAHAIEPGCDENRTFATRAPDGRQSVHKLGRLGVDVEADYVDRLTVPRGRDLDSGNQCHVELGGRPRRLGKAAGFVVVRQREQVYAPRCRPPHQISGCEHSIGESGVGV